MRKLLFTIGALALLGLVSACVDPMDNNPNFNPETNSVTTQFVLNIAAETNAKTKQSASAVQEDQRFRGLNNASLFTFKLSNDGKKVYNITQNEMQHPTSYIDLSYALREGVIDPTGTNAAGTSVPKSRRILQIDLPTGTNALMFYGQAVTGTSRDLKNDFGQLEYDSEGLTELDLTKIGCWAPSRLVQNSNDDADFLNIETMIEAVYNGLFSLEHTFGNDYGVYQLSDKTVAWSDYSSAWVLDPNTNKKVVGVSPIPAKVNLDPVTAAPFEVTLAKAYQAFTEVRSGEYRSGSGQAVLRQMSDLYTIIVESLASEPTNTLETIATYMMTDIRDYLLDFFIAGSGDQALTLTAWQPITAESGKSIRSSIRTRFGTNLPAMKDAKYTIIDFPFIFGLPLGAATMSQNSSTGLFAFNRENMALHGGGSMSVYDYTYPPSLVYYGNSPIRVSNDNSLQNADFPDGATAWEGTGWASNSKWESGTNGFSHVVAATRGVAMAYNIQYGNAMLETKVKFADAVLASSGASRGLADNNAFLNNDPSDNVFYPDVDEEGVYPTIVLTGILIGGQPNKVGWNYMPVEGASFNKMVYDKCLNGVNGDIVEETGASSYELPIPHTKTGTKADATEPNYTLLFDNYSSAATNTNDKVLVCLEFKNYLGKDFWGNTNMVRKEGSFYLLGELTITNDMKEASTNADKKFNWGNVSSIMPPYDPSTGATLTGDEYLRVFMQDHKTKATFVIDHNSLKKAYVTVPDLRSSTLSFGLSVDLTWDPGLDFGEIVL